MEQLTLDTGIREFCLNGRHVLRLNPRDPGLYRRLEEAGEALEHLSREARSLEDLDRLEQELCGILSKALGADLRQLLDGVSLLAVAENGRRVAQNLLEALEPILRQGAEAFVESLREGL